VPTSFAFVLFLYLTEFFYQNAVNDIPLEVYILISHNYSLCTIFHISYGLGVALNVLRMKQRLRVHPGGEKKRVRPYLILISFSPSVSILKLLAVSRPRHAQMPAAICSRISGHRCRDSPVPNHLASRLPPPHAKSMVLPAGAMRRPRCHPVAKQGCNSSSRSGSMPAIPSRRPAATAPSYSATDPAATCDRPRSYKRTPTLLQAASGSATNGHHLCY
jgi:hypothetical protein